MMDGKAPILSFELQASSFYYILVYFITGYYSRLQATTTTSQALKLEALGRLQTLSSLGRQGGWLGTSDNFIQHWFMSSLLLQTLILNPVQP